MRPGLHESLCLQRAACHLRRGSTISIDICRACRHGAQGPTAARVGAVALAARQAELVQLSDVEGIAFQELRVLHTLHGIMALTLRMSRCLI